MNEVIYQITPKHPLANLVQTKIKQFNLTDEQFISPEINTNDVGESIISLNPSIISGKYKIGNFMSQMIA